MPTASLLEQAATTPVAAAAFPQSREPRTLRGAAGGRAHDLGRAAGASPKVAARGAAAQVGPRLLGHRGFNPAAGGRACSPRWQPHLGGSCGEPSSPTACRAVSGPRGARPEQGMGARTPCCVPVPPWAPLLPFARFHTAAANCSRSFWGGVSRHWGQHAT